MLKLKKCARFFKKFRMDQMCQIFFIIIFVRFFLYFCRFLKLKRRCQYKNISLNNIFRTGQQAWPSFRHLPTNKIQISPPSHLSFDKSSKGSKNNNLGYLFLNSHFHKLLFNVLSNYLLS